MISKIKSTLIIISMILMYDCRNNEPESYHRPAVNDDQMIEVNKYLLEKDNELIEAYIKRRNWDMRTTGSGLWYMIFEKGNGKEAQKNKLAEINYSIELLDGTTCYTSESLGSKTFIIGRGDVIQGLEEGILLMQEGDKASFIMPPHLAYHLLGDEKEIPARATIVYNVELLKISDN